LTQATVHNFVPSWEWPVSRYHFPPAPLW
jgi:hypothetical protein